MPKAKQDDLKDVGGYVAGSLQGLRRKADAVSGRDVVTLDSAQQEPQYISRTASKVVGSASSMPIMSVSFRAMGSYSSALTVRSNGIRIRSRCYVGWPVWAVGTAYILPASISRLPPGFGF